MTKEFLMIFDRKMSKATPGSGRKVWLFCFLVAGATIFIGCATSPKPILIQQPSSSNQEGVPPEWKTIFLLTPKLTYQDVQTEAELLPDQYGGKTTSKDIVDFASNVIEQKGLRVLQEHDLTPNQKSQLTVTLAALHDHAGAILKQRNEKEGFLADFRELSEIAGAEGVMGHVLKVKVGAGSYWDPNTGAIASSASTSHILAFLVDATTGEVVWKNEVFFRDVPTTKLLTKSLGMLFSVFPTKKEEETQ